MKSFGIDPVASFELNIEHEVSKTLTCSHGRAGGGAARQIRSIGLKFDVSKGIAEDRELAQTQSVGSNPGYKNGVVSWRI